MTVGELLARMTSREMTEWIAFASIEPIGASRADLQAGVVASTTANVYAQTPLKAVDFMPDFEAAWDRVLELQVDDAEAEVARDIETLRRITLQLGGTVTIGDKS